MLGCICLDQWYCIGGAGAQLSLIEQLAPTDTESTMANSDRSGWAGNVGIVGIAGFAVLCCAGPVVVGTLGVGAVVAALTSWWMLIPAVLVAGGIVGWYAWRRSCRIPTAAHNDASAAVSRGAR